MIAKCTIYFEDPFWVAVVEREDENGYSAARHVFGAEPGDAEVLEFARNRYDHLAFSRPSQRQEALERRVNFKRALREAQRETAERGVGRKAWEAIGRQREEQKQERHGLMKEKTAAEEQRKFELRREKKKQKARGH